MCFIHIWIQIKIRLLQKHLPVVPFYYIRIIKFHNRNNKWKVDFLSVFFFTQGCYSAMVDYFETYIYTAGALAIVVLTIEVRTAFSHSCILKYW